MPFCDFSQSVVDKMIHWAPVFKCWPILCKWICTIPFLLFFKFLRYYAARHKRRLKEEYADHHNEKLRPIDLIALRPKAFKYQVLSQIPSQAPYTEMDEYGLFKNVVSLCCTFIKALTHYNWKYEKMQLSSLYTTIFVATALVFHQRHIWTTIFKLVFSR